MADNDTVTTPRTVTVLKPERPRLHKVILLNDDFTPRHFVVTVLQAEFSLSESQANRVMITAHQKGRVRGRRVHQGHRRDQGDQRDGRGP